MRTIKFYSKQILKFIYYFCNISDFHFSKFPDYEKGKEKKAWVFGNGPSLKLLIERYEKGEIEIDQNSFFVNLAPLSDFFYKIKPNNLFLSDYVFMTDDNNTIDKISNNRNMYRLLQEQVNWPLTIYLTLPKKKDCKQLIEYSQLTNPNIRFVFMNRNHCDSLSASFRNWLYKKAWFMPTEGTVVNTAIFVAILQGYREIDVCGIETSMFLNLKVNDENRAGIVENHFYEGNHFNELKNDDGSVCRVHDYLFSIYHMLKSHHLLRAFADYMNVKIFNCTPDSMVDAYERKKIL